MPNQAIEFSVDTVDVAVANTEYPYLIPNGTVSILFKTRSGNALRYAWESGIVATPAADDPYVLLPEQSSYTNDKIVLSGKTLYFAAAQAEVVEIEIGRG